MNQVKVGYVEKRKQKELKKPKDERKEVKEAVFFEKPTEKKKFIGYGFLDALFKVSKQADYIVLPGQVNQQVMKVVFQNWKSFFTSLKDKSIQEGLNCRSMPLKVGEKNALSRIKYA